MKTTAPSILVTLSLVCVALSFKAQAVSPPPDGGYPGNNTAEGSNALFGLTTGINNTAVGSGALLQDTSGGYNMAVGSRALALNTTGSFNMAIGAEALYNNQANSNTAIGFRVLYFNTLGNNLTGVGAGALYSNTGGVLDTAVGAAALHDNSGGNFNTAVGAGALQSNISGSMNTAIGYQALFSQTAGTHDANAHNTAIGVEALYNNNGGGFCTAVGDHALFSYTHGTTLEPGFNTAVGQDALVNATGDGNTALGAGAGAGVVAASNVTCIGANTAGADVSNTVWIGNVFGVTTVSGTTAPVIVSDGGQLGTVVSSERFKKDIAAMEKASEAILSLRPVTFHYKTDNKGAPQFGLIAEEVAKVNPALVLPDKEGKPYTVRYDAVNLMLLNEFLKEHKAFVEEQHKVEKLEATVAQERKDFEAAVAQLKTQVQEVSAQLEATKPEPQMAENTQ